MKCIVILVKVDEMYNILKSASHCREMKMELDDQSFCWSLALECSYVYYTAPLLSGRLHLVRDTAVEKGFDIAI